MGGFFDGVIVWGKGNHFGDVFFIFNWGDTIENEKNDEIEGKHFFLTLTLTLKNTNLENFVHARKVLERRAVHCVKSARLTNCI